MKKPVGLIGGISEIEGEKLAELASKVLPYYSIVEIGSACGMSSCWLAYGSSIGYGASVHCYDPWENKPEDKDIFDHQILKTGADEFITVHQVKSVDKELDSKVGLWFHDADHTTKAMLHDYSLWKSQFADVMQLAFHDWIAREYKNGEWVRMVPEITHQEFFDTKIRPEAHWSHESIVDYLFTIERYAI